MTETKIRIAVASSGLGRVARGVEAWAADLAAGLVDRGEAVILVKGAGDPALDYERVVRCWSRESRATARLLKFVPAALGWRIGLGSSYEVEQMTFGLGLLALLRRSRIDILHVQDPRVALLTQRARRLGLVRTRTILAHGTEESLGFLRRIDHLQHLAPWHLEASRDAGVWKSTWSAIPNFIDTERYRPGQAPSLRAELGIGPDELVVLTVAAIKRRHKRIDFLIDEFRQLLGCRPDRPIRLVIAGGWETETDELIARGQALLGDRVRFLVRFPRARMAELYRLADVFVLCSLKEMMPIALLEAMASGLPCLVSQHPVVAWMVGSGGETIAMERPGALAEALGRMVADPTSRLTLGDQARERCVAVFHRDRVVDAILDYYQQVLGRDPVSQTVNRSNQ